MTNENEVDQSEAILDFAARVLAVADSAITAQGIDMGAKIMFFSSMALASGITRENVTKVYQRANQYAAEFATKSDEIERAKRDSR